ncbi:MAG TPA: hypothetical protein IAC12_03775 [Candidatus Aphodovivens avistercoris]|nr:hypothetical protein [Candidatus Aphodovivens avistercoris]
MAENQFEVPAYVRAEITSRGYAMPPDMGEHIEQWYQWYTATHPFYTEKYLGVDGRSHERQKLSLRPARRVCREWASLIANEMQARSESADANEWVQGYCEDTGLYALFQRGIERAFAMGTGAMALWFDVRDEGTAIRVRRYDAKMALPLTWDEDGTTECAFCTRVSVKGKQAVQLQMHVMDAEAGTYHIVTKVWRDGKPVPPDVLGIIEDFDTGCGMSTFCLLSPAIDNTVQDTSPYGVSVFHDAVDAMRMLDTAWTALYDETDLLRAVLMVPDTMIAVEADKDGEKRAVPFGSREQRLYRLTAASIGEEGKPYAFAPQMRTGSIHEVYADALAALGDECGFGSQYFQPDKAGGLKTATEVSADNSALMRNIRNHENALGKELGRLLTALVECARIHMGAPVAEGFEPVTVAWDDSIITDTQADKAQMLAEIAAGVVPKWMYLVRFYGMGEDEARAAMPEQAVLDVGF